MTDEQQARKLIEELAGRRAMHVREAVPDSGAQWPGVTAPGDDNDERKTCTDDGLLVVLPRQFDDDGAPLPVAERRIPYGKIVEINEPQGRAHAVFLNAAGAELNRLSSIAPTPQLRRTILAAARSYPAAIDDSLKPSIAALSDAERQRVREVALDALRDGEGLLRGVVLALGFIGTESDALALGDAICEMPDAADWTGGYATEALRLMQRSDAQMQIQRIASQGATSHAVAAARERLLHIASDLGVMVWEVQDQLVPTCGLDAHGGLTLDFGTRRFQLALNESFTPMLVENTTRARFNDLPDESPDDDPARVAAATRTWHVAREQLVEAIPVQVHRFEEAMVQQTRWTADRWQELRRHPLLVHLMPRAVFGAYTRRGRRIASTFRVATDQSLTTADDEPYSLSPDLWVGLAHPFDLDAPLREAWGELLSDYEIATMFPQVDRSTFRANGARDAAHALGFRVPQRYGTLALARRGWVREGNWLTKVFRRHDVAAFLEVSDESHDMTLQRVKFGSYIARPSRSFQLRDVDSVVFSETIYDLEQLRMPQETGGWAAIVKR